MTEPEKKAKPQRSPGKWLIAASGWVAAFAMGILDTPAKINSFFDEGPKAVENVSTAMFLDKGLTGTWGLEGIIDLEDKYVRYMAADNGPVVLGITVYKGRVDGQIWSNGLKDNFVWSPVFVSGRKRGSGIEGVAYDFIGGKRTALAKFYLTTDRDGVAWLRISEQAGAFFPRETPLFKLSGKPDDGMPEHTSSPMFLEAAKKTLAERRAATAGK